MMPWPRYMPILHGGSSIGGRWLRVRYHNLTNTVAQYAYYPNDRTRPGAYVLWLSLIHI